VTSVTPAFKTNLAFVVVDDQLRAATAWPRRTDQPRRRLRDHRQPRVHRIQGSTEAAVRTSTRRPDEHAAAAIWPTSYREWNDQWGGRGRPAPAGDATNHEDRYTIGLDARWRWGRFTFEPTIYYQWGTRDSQAVRTTERSVAWRPI